MEPTFRERTLGAHTDARARGERRFGAAPAHLERTARHASGHVILSDPDTGTHEGETAACAHCQFQWVIAPGSGIVRGFCLRCNAPTCGKEACERECVPFEKMLEKIERRGHIDAAIARTRAL